MLKSLRHKTLLVVAVYASITLLGGIAVYLLTLEQQQYLAHHQDIPDVTEVLFELNNGIHQAEQAQQAGLHSVDSEFITARNAVWQKKIEPASEKLKQLYKAVRVWEGERFEEVRVFYDLRLQILELKSVQNQVSNILHNKTRAEAWEKWAEKEQPLAQQISSEIEFLQHWQDDFARRHYEDLRQNLSILDFWLLAVSVVVPVLVLVLAGYFAKLILNPLRDMSHELRTPLNAIIGFAEILLESGKEEPLSDYRRDRLRRILQSGRHLLELINSLLDLAKIDTGQMQISKSEFNLEHLLRDVLEWLEPLMQEKSLRYESVFLSERPLLLFSDPAKVRQVLINLLGNAIKFTDSGGCVEIRSYQDESGIFIAIQDDGCGIPAEEQQQIFAVFHQVKSSRTQKHSSQGSGLGLALVQSLMDLLGGSIKLESKVGEGSTFTLHFPKSKTPV